MMDKIAKIYVGGVETGTITVTPETRGSKGILEFPLPEEQNRFDVACKSLDFALAWNQLREWVRTKRKYENEIALLTENIQNKMYEIETEFNLPELE